MSLPEKIRVKLSSEAAESISITPVVVREMPLKELIENMLGLTGKDVPRIRELLLRGALVSGASRFRWDGWQADAESLHQLLADFPDPDPRRPFQPELCTRVILTGARHRIEIPREAGERIGPWSRLLRRRSFWDVLMEEVSSPNPRYTDYSYKERADCYRQELSAPAAQRLRGSARLVRYTTLAERLRASPLSSAELYVERVK
ncbi:MAG: hypothetical protein WD696_12070 [Bryobacteraceae bacterium]